LIIVLSKRKAENQHISVEKPSDLSMARDKQEITTFLMFMDQTEEALNFYI